MSPETGVVDGDLFVGRREIRGGNFLTMKGSMCEHLLNARGRPSNAKW